jgi:hypothetical protein
MQHQMTRWPLTVVGLVMLAIFSAPFSAFADGPQQTSGGESDYVEERLAESPKPFNGSFGEFFLRGGPLLTSDDDATSGWHGDLGFRNSFPFYLGDNRLSYGYGRYDVDDRPVQIHGLHLSLNLHPFYLVLLSSGFVSHFLASIHLELGLGPRLGLWSDDAGEAMNQFGLAWSVGGGFDLPLTNPDRGQSLWVSANYRREWTSIGFETDSVSHAVRDHRFFLGLAWRVNGMIW